MKQFYQKVLTLGLTALLFFTTSKVMGQGTEDFTNFPETSGSYLDGSFTGNDGSTWTYLQCRGDQSITAPTPMLGRNRTPDAEMTSGTIAGGIGTLSFNYQQAFSSNVDLDVYVNGALVANVTSSGEQGVLKSSGTITIEVSGDFTLSFQNPNGGQVLVDDVTWTAFAACSAPTTQATFGAFTGTADNATTINFTRGDGDGVIILAKEGSAVDAAPSSGTAYSANAAFGSGDEIGTGNFVVYNGTGTTEDLTALALGTTYHFAAFEYNSTGTCYLTPGATTDVTTTGDALPEIISAVTPATEISNDIIITFSEDVSFTTEGGFAIEIGTPLATIQSQTQTAPDEITLTIAEDISKNSEEIILSYNAFASGASIVDGGAQALQNTNETIVNNTTLNLVANVTEARALSSGEDVRITGGVIVTYLTGNTRNQFFIQDADAGLLVDDNSGTVSTSYSIGDEILNFEGTLSAFGGVTQIVPLSDPGSANSTGNAITPLVTTIADHNASPDTYESRVLQFNEVTFNEADGSATFDAQASATSTLNDGANTLDFDADNGNFDFTNIDYATSVIPQGRLDVIAIGRDSRVSSRSSADIQDNYAPEFTQAPAAGTPTVSAFDVTFRMDEPGRVYYAFEEAPNTGIPAEVVLTSLDFVDYTDVTADGTISLTGLNDGTEYFVHIIAVDDEGTPNEQASTTVVSATTDAVVFDATSDIVAAASPIGAATLSSVANADTDAVDVFNFTVTDDNATDTEPTTINTIVIENNNSATWSTILEGASISDGTNSATATSITDTDITFDVSGSPFFVTGATNLTFTLSVWLQTAQTDGTELSFIIPTDHAFAADASGSVIKPTLDAAVTSATHTIDVVATTFATTTPERVMPNTDFSVGVIAQDANGNTDIAARTIDIFASSGNLGASGNLTSPTGISGQAMTAGEYTWNDLQYDQVEEIILDVTDGSITESTTFISVTETQVETFDNYPETGSSYVDGTFTGQDGSTWTYVQARGDQTIDGVTPMLGRNRTPDAEMTSGTISGGIGTLLFDYSQAFSSDVDLDVFVNGDSITTVTSTDQRDIILNSGSIIVEVEGDFTLSFKNPRGGQVNIDNVAWTPYVDPCVEPTTQATALGATVVDNNTIDLAWTVGNGDATLVLAKQGAAVDAAPEILTAYTADAAFGSGQELGIGNFVVYNGADATVQLTGLTQGTEYHFAAYAFNTADNCYNIIEPAVANATTSSDNDADSDILAADTPIAAGNVPATASSEENAVAVFNFKISDLGTADGEPTIVNSLKIVPGINNTAAWSTVLAGATLTDNVFDANNATITDDAITFDLSANQMIVNDGADSTLTLSVYLNAAQVDGDVLAFEIPTAHEFVAAGEGSLFVDAVTGASSNDHTINVEATTLVLTANATSNTDTPFTIGVSAEDANGNLDTSARTVTVSGGGTGTLTGTTDLTLTDGVGTFTGLSYDTEETVTFTVTDGTLSATTDITFSTPSADNNLFFSEYGEGSSNNKYIEIYNATGADFDLSTVEVKQSNNGSGFDGHPDFPAAYSITLQGTLAAGDVYIIVNASTNIEEIAQEGDLFLSYGNNPGDRVASFNGDDAMGLFVNGELVDLIGDPAVDPGSAWDVAGVTGGTQDHTLVRKSTVTSGNTTALGSFGTTAENSEWEVYEQDNVSFIGFFGDLSTPSIFATTADFDPNFGFVANPNSSEARSYTVSAVNLSENLVITAPAGFELALDADFTTPAGTLNLAPVDGTVADTEIFVRFTPTAADGAVYSGDITHTSADATTQSIAVTGTEGSLTLSSIADARNVEIGGLVKVTGIVIGGPNHSSLNRLIYDGTAGIVVRGENSGDLILGDSVTVEGEMDEFASLLQIAPTTAIIIEATGKALPAAKDVTIAEIGETYESQLIRLTNVTFVESGQFLGGGGDGNFTVTNGSGETITFRLGSSSHPLVETDIPTEPVNITAWVSQFNEDYQVSPENASDVVIAPTDPEVTITAPAEGFSFGTIETGSVSAAQSFTVSGLNLTVDITIAASANYQVSLIENDAYDTNTTLPVNPDGSLEEITVFVRFAPTAEVGGTINGTVTVNSADFDETTINLSASEQLVVTANAKNQLTGVLVFPNPAQNQLNVNIEQGGEFTYQLIGLQGATLIKGAGNAKQTINVSALKAGVYILEVSQKGKSFRSRVIKR